MVIGVTLAFAPADDSAAFAISANFRDNSPLTFGTGIATEIDNDPIGVSAKPMRQIGVGEQYREMPVSSLRMEDWKPGFIRRIESSWCDPPKLAGRGLFAILAIDVQEDIDAGFLRRLRHPPPTAKLLRKLGANHCDSARPEVGNLRKTTVMGRHFKGFKAVDMERIH